jgi:predicted RNase H-like nuclease
MQFLGIDLAWADNPGSLANETGLVLLAGDGTVVDAGWSRGIQETLGWVSEHVHGSDVLAFVDAPLVVSNATGQRLCETQVGQRYGHWKVSANSTNLGSKNIAGVSLLELLEERGWIYDDRPRCWNRSGGPSPRPRPPTRTRSASRSRAGTPSGVRLG